MGARVWEGEFPQPFSNGGNISHVRINLPQ